MQKIYLLKYVHFHDNGFKHYSFLATEGEHDVARIKRAFGSSAPPCNSKWEFNVFDFFVSK